MINPLFFFKNKKVGVNIGLLKLSRKLDALSRWARYNSTYFKMKYYVKKALKDDDGYIHMEPITHYMRDIGKSYSLVKLALKYDIPIAVPLQNMGYHLQHIARDEFNRNDLSIVWANGHSIGKRYDFLLAEEGFNDDVLNNVVYRMCNKVIGYINR